MKWEQYREEMERIKSTSVKFVNNTAGDVWEARSIALGVCPMGPTSWGVGLKASNNIDDVTHLSTSNVHELIIALQNMLALVDEANEIERKHREAVQKT